MKIVKHNLHTDVFLKRKILSKWSIGWWLYFTRTREYDDEEYQKIMSVSYQLELIGRNRSVNFEYTSHEPRNKHF